MDNKTNTSQGIILLLLLIFASCTSKERSSEKIDQTTLFSDIIFNELSDSSFVPSRVMCMSFFGDDLYFSDYSGRIVVLDNYLKVKKSIGFRGQGPGELLGAAHFHVISDDSICVFNEGKRALELFVDGKQVKHIPFPKETRLTDCTRFFLYDQLVFHSIVANDYPVVTFDHASRINRFICNYTVWDKPGFQLHSARHLLKGDNVFFTIGCTLPIFQIYSFEGDLFMEYDLKKIPEIEKIMKIYEITPQVPTNYFTMIQDVCYDNHKVYLLISTKEDKYSCNTICVLNVMDKIKHIQTFHLPEQVYESFCVKDGKLVAFDKFNASLNLFTLP